MATMTKEKSYGQKIAAELKEKEEKAAKLKAEKEAKEVTKPSAADKSRAKRQARVPHPALVFDAQGNLPAANRLTTYPADFDDKVHLPLERKHFTNEAPWLLNRAERAERLALSLRKQAADAMKFGNAKDRAKVKKMRHMQEVMAKLEAELAEQGIDVAELRPAEEAEVK